LNYLYIHIVFLLGIAIVGTVINIPNNTIIKYLKRCKLLICS